MTTQHFPEIPPGYLSGILDQIQETGGRVLFPIPDDDPERECMDCGCCSKQQCDRQTCSRRCPCRED
jgi:hypothetical protein